MKAESLLDKSFCAWEIDEKFKQKEEELRQPIANLLAA